MRMLFVGLDPLAGLRQAGGSRDPEPAAAAALAELAGASGIRISYWGERGGVQERDVRLLKEVVRGTFVLRIPPRDEGLRLALAVRPDAVLLAPDSREGVGVAIGLDVEDRREELAPLLETLRSGGIQPGLTVDPIPGQIKAAQRAGAAWILVHAGRLSWAAGEAARAAEHEALVNAAKVAHRLGMPVHVGGGLGYQTAPIVGRIGEIEGVHLGQSLIARSALVGIAEAVREARRLLQSEAAG
jgi:pyridoxine 5-phosphate synthase